jgi:uncharacterized protein YbjT (DUF2867 family)
VKLRRCRVLVDSLRSGAQNPAVKVIVTGTTGMVGEGIMLACLEDPQVEKVLSVSRRPCGHTHEKLAELLLPDFRDTSGVEAQLTGYDACFYGAGISSIGLKEPEYTAITYDTPVAFATTLARLNPGMTLVHVSGASTDGTEQGRVMWARVKGRAENALMRLPFKGVYNFRPGLMEPFPGQKHLKGGWILKALFPVAALFFPAIPLRDIARAMTNAVRLGAPKQVLEVPDIKELAAR